MHIVPHMHWDREWYFSAEESKLLLINNMEEIMDRLESDPNYPVYVLDGQTAILEDYFTIKPDAMARVKKLVQEGRLVIGPWYTQTDEMVVGGESIVRNLLYGYRDCQKIGPIMKIGYLPDSFGQSGQMPMILNGFGITRSMFWRGTSERMGSNKTEFYWESDDGSKVLTQLLPLGYAIGKYLPINETELKERCNKYFPVLERGATSENLLLPNGHDQMPIQKNINEVIEKLEKVYPDKDFFLSSYENVFNELEKNSNYDTLYGELLDGKYMRVHRSIFSSRSDIKSYNTIIENKITNILEPLASLAYTLGFPYYEDVIEGIWKDIMKNHAHDSIGCCCSDKVHREILERFILADEKVEALITFYKRKIVDAMPSTISLDKVVLFNLLPYEREGIFTVEVTTRMRNFTLTDENHQPIDFSVISKKEVDAGIIDRQIVHYGNYDPFVKYTIQIESSIPAMGYKTFFIIETTEECEVVKDEASELENEYFKIKINTNGTLDIEDLQNNCSYSSVLLLEDGGDDGDSYDYSPLQDDYVITSREVTAKIDITKYKHSSKATINYQWLLPKDIESRKKKILDGSIDVAFQISLHDKSPFIDVDVSINNRVNDHRLRVTIPTHITGKQSVSDNQFGMISRPVYDVAMEVWKKEKWSERPDSIYPMLSYCAIKEVPLAIITKSIREYEIIGQNYDTIALTLYRSVGYLGKENLVRRPGRPSGIKLPTPDSQLLKELNFSFSLVSERNQTSLSRLAKECLTPIVMYNKMPYNAMKLNPVNFITPYEYSLLMEQNSDLTLSVLKKAQDSNHLVYRVFNTNEMTKKLELTGVNVDTSINLNEEIVKDSRSVRKNQVRGYLIKYDK